jgi:hypothetical protein
MEIRDLEIEAIKIDSFKAGYQAALQSVANMLNAEKAKADESTKKDKESVGA